MNLPAANKQVPAHFQDLRAIDLPVLSRGGESVIYRARRRKPRRDATSRDPGRTSLVVKTTTEYLSVMGAASSPPNDAPMHDRNSQNCAPTNSCRHSCHPFVLPQSAAVRASGLARRRYLTATVHDRRRHPSSVRRYSRLGGPRRFSCHNRVWKLYGPNALNGNAIRPGLEARPRVRCPSAGSRRTQTGRADSGVDPTCRFLGSATRQDAPPSEIRGE